MSDSLILLFLSGSFMDHSVKPLQKGEMKEDGELWPAWYNPRG